MLINLLFSILLSTAILGVSFNTSTKEAKNELQVRYSIFLDSLSISFGPIGASIDVNSKLVDTIEGTPMTLKGYSNQIEPTTYTVYQAEWGFDARYYFSNEGIKTKTLYVDDLIIDTKRLRCGYIEDEYINLSPNRYDAGDAYLELSFNKPIYELDTYMSFWSASEGLDKS